MVSFPAPPQTPNTDMSPVTTPSPFCSLSTPAKQREDWGKKTTTPRGTWVPMGPDFLGDSSTFSCTEARWETASHTCPEIAPRAGSVRFPILPRASTPGPGLSVLVHPTIIYLTSSASSRKPVGIALANINNVLTMEIPQWHCPTSVQTTWGTRRVSGATHAVLHCPVG